MADEKTKDIFLTLNSINVNEHVEQKDTGKQKLNYLSWVWAWQEVRKRYPDATYDIARNEYNLPYFYDPNCGIMVYTSVTICGETHSMWLPVMDGANNAMKFEPYEITTKFGGTKTVNRATMMDINKAVMRCLAKNLAMFGLGLYIYAGEDLPEENEETKASLAQLVEDVTAEITRIKERDKVTTQEQKKQLAVEHIIPFLGNANYKMCKDADKLASLLEHLKAA